MKIYTLCQSMFVPVPQRRAFAFFEDPRNLSRITPPWLDFRIANAASVRMGKGARVDYQIRWLGLRLIWKTLITEYEPPRFFVDQQIAGPYALWRHEHTVDPASGGTLIGDRVDYALPLGWLGRLAHRLLVRRQLEAIFHYRRRAIGRILV
jgi:ligand-binding SRPBCC domain-containing protein